MATGDPYCEKHGFLPCTCHLDIAPSKKTYRAIQHDVIREKQANNCPTTHHPEEKKEQIEKTLHGKSDLKILELFAGQGNMTSVYKHYGTVDAYDKKHLKTGDSYLVYHRLIAEKKKYDVIDLDPYGFPNRFFPDIYLLINTGYLFVTMPKPYVNVLNGITQAHLISYYGTHNPSYSEVVERVALWGLCHWRKIVILDSIDLKSVWRFAFEVEKVKATDYTGVKNR